MPISSRRRLYLIAGLCLFLAGLAAVSCKPRFDLIVADGRYYYVYLPSLFVDGDLDFHNQIVEHWPAAEHPALGLDLSGRGLANNRFPVGVALTLAPAFTVAHAVAHLGHAVTGCSCFAPDGYSAAYQILLFAWLTVLVVLTLCLLDGLLTEAFALPPDAVLFAIFLTLAGSPWLYYTFREPFMAHATGAFWVTASVFLVWRSLQRVEQGALPVLTGWLLLFSAAMAVVCRPTNVFVAPFGAWLLWLIARKGLLLRLLAAAPVLLTALLPAAVQMLAWYALHGRFVTYSYGPHHVFDWGHPALWQTLFSSRHGLFFWSPLMLVAFLGAVYRLARGGPGQALVTCHLVAFAILWYCNSAWCCWWFGDSCGSRAFVELSGLFVLGMSALLAAVQEMSLPARRAFAVAAAAGVAVNLALMGSYILHRIPRDDYLLPGF